jgi:hypothetical protein
MVWDSDIVQNFDFSSSWMVAANPIATSKHNMVVLLGHLKRFYAMVSSWLK